MTNSKPVFVYLQRPDTGDWVTVGRYLKPTETSSGTFRYAPSYANAGLAWSIDPVRRIGAPAEDRIELFGRMIFNALCGNDDDHVRNHAAVYRHEEKRWRLAPAFDVVPNPVETPRTLMLQLSMGRFDICRASMLTDARRFGFASGEEAERYLDALLVRIRKGFETTAHLLDFHWQALLLERLQDNMKVLDR